MLSDGKVLETDLFLSATGLVPNTQMADKAGLATDIGIAANNIMQASSPDVYPIGDCASLSGQVFAYIEPIRRQAEAIAADICGEQERFMPAPPGEGEDAEYADQRLSPVRAHCRRCLGCR